jgi:uncharacterized RDD family membrane protein YckC
MGCTAQSDHMQFSSKPGVFTPHESHRTVVLAGVPLASFRRRAAALTIDFLLLALLWIPLKISVPYFVEHKLHISDEAHALNVRHGHISVKYEPEQTLELLWTLCLIIYFGIFLRITNGFTPGKRLMRIRVVSLTHDRLGTWQALERTLGYGASLLEGGFGFVQYFLYPNHLCAHDRLAETIVISLPRKVKEKNAEEVEQAEQPISADSSK